MFEFDKIMKGFTKTITALEKLAARKQVDAERMGVEIAKRRWQRVETVRESKRADETAEKLKALMGIE